jgi:transposase, IS5 family
MEALIGNTIEGLLADKGYRGHNAPPDYKFRVFTSGQKRRVTPKIKRELRRRSAVEPVIGHLKSENRMGRNYLWHRQGDAINAVLAGAGCSAASSDGCSSCCAKTASSFILRLQLVPS